MHAEDIAAWLAAETLLAPLGAQLLVLLAEQIEEQSVAANRRLVLEDTDPEALIILREGRLESYRTSADGPALASSLIAGAVIHLGELLLGQNTQRTLVTLTDCRLWTIPAVRLRALLAAHPALAAALSALVAGQMAQLTARLDFEQQRGAALRPHLITRARRGIVGRSRYAVALRDQIRSASADRAPVLIFGEPGLEKDNIAALIHFGSPRRREPVIQLNAAALKPDGSDLLGRPGRRGLIDWLGEGTLVLNNVQELTSAQLAQIKHLLTTGRYRPVTRPDEPPAPERPLLARIVMVAERADLELERLVGHYLKVPPLRVRRADMAALVAYYLNLLQRSEGMPRPRVAPEALRRLQSYDFPGNLAELRNLIERAVSQAGEAAVLTEEIFWPAQGRKKRFRFNLLNAYPWLRQFLRSPWWPDRINFGFTAGFFVFIVAVLFLGPQQREANFALNFFWAWWWPLILIAFPIVGRLWCAVCPFMIWGEIVQKVSLKLFPRQLWRWPRQEAERWGGWFLFGLFLLIFLWEELWNLPDTAYLSAWLLLLITGGAVVCSLLFERRFWCRYLCPIGGMNGLYAKLAITELRAEQGICSATCTTYQCYKGGPAKLEGQTTEGCPLYSHPAQLQDNRDCVLCMTCLKACPHRSVAVNLRPPGIELWTTHTPRAYEVALLLLLLGGVFLHQLDAIGTWLGWSIGSFWSHLGLAIIALALPLPLVFAGYLLVRWLTGSQAKSFIELAYGYLPLVLAGTLAHYLPLGLGEAGQILPVTWRTFGLDGSTLPTIAAHPAVISFLQGATLLVGIGLAVWLTQKIARQSLRLLLPQHLAAFGLTAGLWKLIVGL